MHLHVPVATRRLAFCIKRALIGIKGCILFGSRDTFCSLALGKHAGPYWECRDFFSPWGWGSPPWHELVGAAFPKHSVEAKALLGSTYTVELWFVLLQRRYRKEKFLVVHLKRGSSYI